MVPRTAPLPVNEDEVQSSASGSPLVSTNSRSSVGSPRALTSNESSGQSQVPSAVLGATPAGVSEVKHIPSLNRGAESVPETLETVPLPPLYPPPSDPWVERERKMQVNRQKLKNLKETQPTWSGWVVIQDGKLYGQGSSREEAFEQADENHKFNPAQDCLCTEVAAKN